MKIFYEDIDSGKPLQMLHGNSATMKGVCLNLGLLTISDSCTDMVAYFRSGNNKEAIDT